MITKYSKLAAGKGYVSIKVDPRDARAIHRVVTSLGIVNGLKPTEYHCTLIYDKTNPNILFEAPTRNYHATPDTVLTLGPGVRDAIVLYLKDCPELVELHRKLMRMGYKHSFPTFAPHISLKYKPTRKDVETLRQKFLEKLDMKTIRLQTVTVEALS